MSRGLLLALLLAIPILASGQEQRALKPAIEVGDRWTYRATNIVGPGTEEYDLEVTSVHADLIQGVCTRKRDGKEFDGAYTGEWSETSPCSGIIFRPAPRFLQFPLSVGKTYSSQFTFQRVRDGPYAQQGESTTVVRGWEDIEVPAGRFRAMRVETTMAFTLPNSSDIARRVTTFWYSPEVRRWVRRVSTSRGGDTYAEELLGFKLKE